MSVKKPNPLPAQSINMRSRRLRLTVKALRIAKTHIVGHNENDIRFLTPDCVAGPKPKPRSKNRGRSNANTPKKTTPSLF